MKDYYVILGVLPDAEDIVIKAAYKALVQRYHPDRYKGNAQEAQRKTAELNEAYEVLSNPQKRADYDRKRKSSQGSTSDYDDTDTNDGYSSFQELDEDWQFAVEYYPDLAQLEARLRKISMPLSIGFKQAILETKKFESRHEIAKVLEQRFLETYFGSHPKLLEFALKLIFDGKKLGAKELNKAVNLFGDSIDADAVIKKLTAKHYAEEIAEEARKKQQEEQRQKEEQERKLEEIFKKEEKQRVLEKQKADAKAKKNAILFKIIVIAVLVISSVVFIYKITKEYLEEQQKLEKAKLIKQAEESQLLERRRVEERWQAEKQRLAQIRYEEERKKEEIRQIEEQRLAEIKKRENELKDAQRYRNNQDGTVTDTQTGLQWKRCAEGQTWTGHSCLGEAKIYNWNDAIKLTNKFAGKTDWRLPTQEELLSIRYCSKGGSGNSCSDGSSSPTISMQVFPSTSSTLQSFFWSSSPNPSDSYYGWGVDFDSGNGYDYYRYNNHHVRLVRGGQ